VSLVHGSPRDPLREYIVSLGVARANLAALTTPLGLHGHTHVPVAFIDDGADIALIEPRDGAGLALDERPTLLNPGSVGQPRDGDPRASYLVLDTEANVATWRRTAYDVAAVQVAIRAAGLPPRLADRLAIGA
jgi:diadenosine tetraphosphatase ApaH/serine/threonine PP2A family protein phosphatase